MIEEKTVVPNPISRLFEIKAAHRYDPVTFELACIAIAQVRNFARADYQQKLGLVIAMRHTRALLEVRGISV